MSAHHVIADAQLYRLTSQAWEKTLLVWARNGQRPEFTAWKGVRFIGPVDVVDDWTLAEVEQAMWAHLREGRQAPAGDGDRDEPTPDGASRKPAGKGWKL